MTGNAVEFDVRRGSDPADLVSIDGCLVCREGIDEEDAFLEPNRLKGFNVMLEGDARECDEQKVFWRRSRVAILMIVVKCLPVVCFGYVTGRAYCFGERKQRSWVRQISEGAMLGRSGFQVLVPRVVTAVCLYILWSSSNFVMNLVLTTS